MPATMAGRTIVAGLVGVAVGAAGAYLWLQRTSPATPAAAEETTPSTEADDTIARARITPMVCATLANLRGSKEPDPTDVQAGELWLLRGQLQACRDDRKRIRHGFDPQGPATERPETWTRHVEDAIDACDLPFEVDVVECSEYPCVAGLRPTDALPTEPADEEMAGRLDARLDACASLRQAFSIGDDQLDALQIHEIELPCGDPESPETAFALVAMDTSGEAWRAWQNRDDDIEGVMRWMFRRGDDLAAMIPCEGAP
jgi:hypothetical protein